jgi:hypothetical protein
MTGRLRNGHKPATTPREDEWECALGGAVSSEIISTMR